MSLPSISRSFSRSLGLRSISSKRITFRNLILSSSFLTLQPRRYFVQEPTSGVTKNTVDDNVGAPPIPEPSTTAFTSAQKLKSSPFQKFQTKPQTESGFDPFNLDEEYENMTISEGTQPTETTPLKQPFFAIYRAMKEPSKGAAIQFSYSPQKKCVYLTAARQAGPKLPPNVSGKQFDYNNKIVAKLNVQEMAGIVRVLREQMPQLDLFHMVNTGTNKSQTQIRLKFNPSNKTTLIQIVKRVSAPTTQSTMDPALEEPLSDLSDSSANVAVGTVQNTVGLYITPSDATALEVFFVSAMRDAMGFK